VRGLKTDLRKRKKIFFDFNQKYSSDIIFLQETHSTPQIETEWNRDWDGQIFYSHGTSRSRGTAILIQRHLVDKVIEVSKDTDGRFVIIVIEYTLINIYAPTQLDENEQIMFLHTLRDELVLHEYENIILGGDFNIVLNPCMDKKGGNININRNARYRI
jgi:exonuclease III